MSVWHARLQMEFRISAKIFLLHEVFNTSVDKYVEIAVREPLTSPPSTLFSALHHLCATFFFHTRFFPAEEPHGGKKIFLRKTLIDERTVRIFFCFAKLLILNGQPRISLQYHFGGRSRCTLMVCLGSVMSSQCPYVFHPSATT